MYLCGLLYDSPREGMGREEVKNGTGRSREEVKNKTGRRREEVKNRTERNREEVSIRTGRRVGWDINIRNI